MRQRAFKALSAAIGPLDRADKSKLWRRGDLYSYSPAFDSYVDARQSVTIKPGESLAELEHIYIGIIAIANG